MAAKPIWNYIPPALIAINTLLVGGNWYLRPQSARSWFVVLLVLIGMTLALVFASREPKVEATRRDAGGSVRRGIVTAGLILVISLGAKLAVALGAVHYGDIALRATMAIAGAFLAVTGNAIPKTLTPLAAQHCDPAKVQAVQRHAGWIWALAGLAVAVAWITLPINLAEATSFFLLPSAILVTVAPAVWLRWAKPSAL
ncbi:MAG: hypothetical protein WAN13_09885 [Candidatus Acidiferrales bacterium]